MDSGYLLPTRARELVAKSDKLESFRILISHQTMTNETSDKVLILC